MSTPGPELLRTVVLRDYQTPGSRLRIAVEVVAVEGRPVVGAAVLLDDIRIVDTAVNLDHPDGATTLVHDDRAAREHSPAVLACIAAHADNAGRARPAVDLLAAAFRPDR